MTMVNNFFQGMQNFEHNYLFLFEAYENLNNQSSAKTVSIDFFFIYHICFSSF